MMAAGTIDFRSLGIQNTVAFTCIPAQQLHVKNILNMHLNSLGSKIFCA